MKSIIRKIIPTLLLSAALLMPVSPVLAVSLSNFPPVTSGPCQGDTTSADCGNVNAPSPTLDGSTTENVLKLIFGIAAVLSILFVAIGGFRYTVSGGDSNATKGAKDTILYALIGLAISVSAFAIVQFIVGNL